MWRILKQLLNKQRIHPTYPGYSFRLYSSSAVNRPKILDKDSASSKRGLDDMLEMISKQHLIENLHGSEQDLRELTLKVEELAEEIEVPVKVSEQKTIAPVKTFKENTTAILKSLKEDAIELIETFKEEILSDKRSRGAFGEVQLSGLIRNVMPESAFALQHTLSNGKRSDCILFLPEPTGNVVLDAKFALAN